jgi:hypothetical protein
MKLLIGCFRQPSFSCNLKRFLLINGGMCACLPWAKDTVLVVHRPVTVLGERGECPSISYNRWADLESRIGPLWPTVPSPGRIRRVESLCRGGGICGVRQTEMGVFYCVTVHFSFASSNVLQLVQRDVEQSWKTTKKTFCIKLDAISLIECRHFAVT